MSAKDKMDGVKKVALRERALKAATAMNYRRNPDWFDRLCIENPELGKEVRDLLVEWRNGGEISRAFPNKLEFCRFLVGQGELKLSVHTLALWMVKFARNEKNLDRI